MTIRASASERFWAKTTYRGDGCIIWGGATGGGGYGLFTFEGRLQLAHRVAWMLEKGPIPVGLTLDHLCKTRLCVNTEHLEPVTALENIRRANVGRRLTRCRKGLHEMSGANIYIWKNQRMCRSCFLEANRRYGKTYRERHPEIEAARWKRKQARRKAAAAHIVEVSA